MLLTVFLHCCLPTSSSNWFRWGLWLMGYLPPRYRQSIPLVDTDRVLGPRLRWAQMWWGNGCPQSPFYVSCFHCICTRIPYVWNLSPAFNYILTAVSVRLISCCRIHLKHHSGINLANWSISDLSLLLEKKCVSAFLFLSPHLNYSYKKKWYFSVLMTQ